MDADTSKALTDLGNTINGLREQVTQSEGKRSDLEKKLAESESHLKKLLEKVFPVEAPKITIVEPPKPEEGCKCLVCDTIRALPK